jgi:hypothetical protein
LPRGRKPRRNAIGESDIIGEANERQKERSGRPHWRVKTPSVLEQFQCESVVYEFDIPLKMFDARAFSKKTGIKSSWSAVLNPLERSSGYHVHFKGRIEKRSVSFKVEYWDWGAPMPGDVEPFAESMMQWIRSFIKVPSLRVFARATFEKPKDKWIGPGDGNSIQVGQARPRIALPAVVPFRKREPPCVRGACSCLRR